MLGTKPLTHASAAAYEVERVLGRYLVEVVERHALCPWARASRERDELAVVVLWGEPTIEAWRAAATDAFASPSTVIAMIVAPELAIARGEFHAVRDQVGAQLAWAGIAEFHPDAPLDLATPARLVPFLRRAPDPLLQIVRRSTLDAVRGRHGSTSLAHQANMLLGHATPPRLPITERIARDNHATMAAAHAEMTAVLDDIAVDRRDAYHRVGIRTSR